MSARARPALVGLLLLAAACGTSGEWTARGKDYFSRGEFEQAWFSLRVARHEGEDPEEIERLYWPFRQAFLLKHAQQLVFANEDALALEDLAKVLAVDPDNKIAKLWSRKAKDKLALQATERGDQLAWGGDLEGALIAYHEALTFSPGMPLAEQGIQAVAAKWQGRRDKAQARYLAGVRTLAEQLFTQTRYHMLIALDADPSLEQARESRQAADTRINEARFRRAIEMAEQGYHAAALHDLKRIEAEQPEFPGLAERIAATQVEIEAARVAREGEFALFRGRYEEAREKFDQAFELSVAQRPRYADMLLMARQRQFEDAYVIAKDIELQGDLDDAVARFREIHGAMPGFLDVEARLTDLEASIAAGRVAYQAGVAAETAGEIDAAIESYSEAILHYPKVDDAAERLAKLRASR